MMPRVRFSSFFDDWYSAPCIDHHSAAQLNVVCKYTLALFRIKQCIRTRTLHLPSPTLPSQPFGPCSTASPEKDRGGVVA